MMNSLLKQRSKLLIIPASPSESDEAESFTFKFDLHKRQNLRKFLVLRKNKDGRRRKISKGNKHFKNSSEVESSINEVNNSKVITEMFDKSQNPKRQSNPNSKLDVGYFSLSFSSDSHIYDDSAKNSSGLYLDTTRENYNNENNKSDSQEKSIDDNLETFCIKRKLWPKINSEKCQNMSITKCDSISCTNSEDISLKEGSISRKNDTCIYTKKILELRKQFHRLAKQLKFCEADEDKCFIIIKIVFCFLKGPYNHLCDTLVPKIILMVKDMSRNEDSKLCCSLVMFALTKTELISNFSEVATLVISLMKEDMLLSLKKQDNRNQIKSEKHLSMLKWIGERENFEIISQYSTIDFAVDCILKFIAYSKSDVYKSELRCAGGLDVILDIVNSHAIDVWNKHLPLNVQLYNITKLEHCLNILQNVIFNIPENQLHVLNYKNFQLMLNVNSILHFIQQKFLCERLNEVPLTEYLHCLSSVLKLLINITHHNVQGSIQVEAHGEIINTILFFLTSLLHLKQETDITLLCLGLVSNLITTSKHNLHKLTAKKMKCLGFQNEMDIIVVLSKLFQNLLLEVKRLEAETENLLYINAFQYSTNIEGSDDNASTVFHSAGHHMEKSMMCSHLALIIGYIIEDNKENAYIVKKALPSIQFGDMADILKEFHDFIGFTDLLDNIHLQEINSIVDVLFSL